MSYSDLAQALQARILANVKAGTLTDTLAPEVRPNAGAMEAHIATLEQAVAEAEILGAQWRQEAEMAAKRLEALQAEIATLKKAVAGVEALSEQRRREAETATKRADHLVAELIAMTSELVAMSKRNNRN